MDEVNSSNSFLVYNNFLLTLCKSISGFLDMIESDWLSDF